MHDLTHYYSPCCSLCVPAAEAAIITNWPFCPETTCRYLPPKQFTQLTVDDPFTTFTQLPGKHPHLAATIGSRLKLTPAQQDTMTTIPEVPPFLPRKAADSLRFVEIRRDWHQLSILYSTVTQTALFVHRPIEHPPSLKTSEICRPPLPQRNPGTISA